MGRVKPVPKLGPFHMQLKRYKNRSWSVIYTDPLTGRRRERTLRTQDEQQAQDAIERIERALLIGAPDPNPHRPSKHPKANSNDKKIGVIYFIEAMGLGLVKIGWSATPVPRIQQINSTSPVPTSVIGLTTGTQADEAAMHEFYRDCHHRFEWFHLTNQLRKYIMETTGKAETEGGWFDLARSMAAKAAARSGGANRGRNQEHVSELSKSDDASRCTE